MKLSKDYESYSEVMQSPFDGYDTVKRNLKDAWRIGRMVTGGSYNRTVNQGDLYF